MFDDSEDLSQSKYWPSVSDLFMTLFIITMVLLAAYQVFQPTSPKDYKRVVDVVGGLELHSIKEPTNKIRRTLGKPDLDQQLDAELVVKALAETADEVVQRLNDSNTELAALKAQIAHLEKLLNDKPPIIRIAEGGKDGKEEYRFESGKAILSDAFKKGLFEGGFMELAGEILSRNKDGQLMVDTLEIIGHTDGVPVAHQGNLDNQLPAFLTGDRQTLQKLAAGSNNDLGLLRALAIKEAWLDFVAEHVERAKLEQVDLRCYSAGQTIPDGYEGGRPSDPAVFRTANEKSRRIEIRLTKLK